MTLVVRCLVTGVGVAVGIAIGVCASCIIVIIVVLIYRFKLKNRFASVLSYKMSQTLVLVVLLTP